MQNLASISTVVETKSLSSCTLWLANSKETKQQIASVAKWGNNCLCYRYGDSLVTKNNTVHSIHAFSWSVLTSKPSN